MDGMEDPVTHASKPPHLYWAHRIESVDETYQAFAQGCALSDSRGCPIASDTATGPGIVDWTRDLLGVCTSIYHRLKPHSHLRQVAHDYARSSGNNNYRSVLLVNAIFDILYTPNRWADFAAGTFYGFYRDLVQASGSNLTIASRSLWTLPEMKRQSGQDWPAYTFQAITCGDSVDGGGTTTQAVFDELTRVVKDVSPMCECQNAGCFLDHPSHLSSAVSSRRPVPPRYSLLPPMACSCCRKVHWSMEQHVEEPHHHHRKQG